MEGEREREGWKQEGRERVKCRQIGIEERAGGLDEKRDSKINLSYFEFEYAVVVVLQIEASGESCLNSSELCLLVEI